MELTKREVAILLTSLGAVAYFVQNVPEGLEACANLIYDTTNGKERRTVAEKLMAMAGLTTDDNAMNILQGSLISSVIDEVKDEVKTEMQ